MKLQQMRFLAAVVQNKLNITTAASKLGATQPAVSKQLKLLEAELGFSLFVRSGRALTRMTPSGERVLRHALRLLQEAQNIKKVADDYQDESHGALSIGTTHTQARYALPKPIESFRNLYPNVQFHLHQGTSEQLADMARLNRVDFVIATGSHELFGGHLLLPWYQWRRRIVVPAGHPLARTDRVSLRQLAAYPLITYVFSLTGTSSLHEVFARAKLRCDVALTARDSDVIKTYVRLGLGVGIVADIAMDAELDGDLESLDTSHLFPVHTTWVGFPREALLRGYMYEFLRLLAPHLSRRLVERAANCRTQLEVDALFAGIHLPTAGGDGFN